MWAASRWLDAFADRRRTHPLSGWSDTWAGTSFTVPTLSGNFSFDADRVEQSRVPFLVLVVDQEDPFLRVMASTVASQDKFLTQVRDDSHLFRCPLSGAVCASAPRGTEQKPGTERSMA